MASEIYKRKAYAIKAPALYHILGVGGMLLFDGALFVCGLLAAIIFYLDARARIKDFEYIQSLTQKEYRKEILDKMRYTQCQRDAAVAGSNDMAAANHYYRSLGYRWYHIFPDKFFTKESPLIKCRFWKITEI